MWAKALGYDREMELFFFTGLENGLILCSQECTQQQQLYEWKHRVDRLILDNQAQTLMDIFTFIVEF